MGAVGRSNVQITDSGIFSCACSCDSVAIGSVGCAEVREETWRCLEAFRGGISMAHGVSVYTRSVSPFSNAEQPKYQPRCPKSSVLCHWESLPTKHEHRVVLDSCILDTGPTTHITRLANTVDIIQLDRVEHCNCGKAMSDTCEEMMEEID